MSEKSKLITVYPVVSGNGAKFVATNLANALKQEHNDKKVALVDFDLKKPFLAHSITEFDDVHGIDNLIDKIDGNMLSNDLFLENMIPMKNNVDLLKGTKLLGKHKTFMGEHVIKIIEMLRDNYDYIVVAVAPEVDNAGTVHGLNEADEVVLVLRNNIANIKVLENAFMKIYQYKKENVPIMGIYNMFSSVTKIDFGRELKDHGTDVIGIIEYDEASVDNQNLATGAMKSLFKSKNKNTEVFAKAVKQL